MDENAKEIEFVRRLPYITFAFNVMWLPLMEFSMQLDADLLC